MNNELLINLLVNIILPFIILMAAEIVYFRIASHFNIIDRPNERSSHAIPTIRGGGVIFVLSVILFFCWNNFSYPYLLVAVLISGIVSFIDDIRTVNNRLKFSVHVISVLLIFKECGILTGMHPLYLVAIGIFFIGVINAYNFMDGINGITGLYSLAVFVPLFITESNKKLLSLELFIIIGLAIFNFFNSRKKARCFAGDVGSISLAILIVFILIMRIQETSHLEYIGLLIVYGIDAIYTIGQRLYQRENIFKPHRKHLYQYYSNEKKTPQIRVSVSYALLQFLISLAIVYGYLDYAGLLLLLLILSIVYWILKLPFLRVTASR
ncbi:MAG: UDP-GlcNAc--UDP-phosphate GlcNAc-1-phosphate transferase [Ferruginibacter sp.]